MIFNKIYGSRSIQNSALPAITVCEQYSKNKNKNKNVYFPSPTILYIQCYILLWRIMIDHSQPAGCIKYNY
jgi:hypothetical protein